MTMRRIPGLSGRIPRRGYQLVAEVEFPEEPAPEPGRYRLDRKLGEGRMGEVWLAQDTELGRLVALKFLRPESEEDKTLRRRLRREARAAAALDHPYICKVYETGTLDGRSFIAMEYLEGEKLSDRLKQGPLPMNLALRIAQELAEGLQEAHRHGIVHRDIKPSNVILTEQGHVKITDFGIAKRFRKAEGDGGDWTVTKAEQESPGTPDYMSPEQIRGDPVDQRSDLFQFGMVLFEMLTGVHPFRRETKAETTAAILNEQPLPIDKLRRDISELLQHLVEKLLAKDPDGRYRSAAEVRTDLVAIIERSNSGASPRAILRLSRLWAPLAGAALITLLAVSSWEFLHEDGTHRTVGQVFRSQVELPKDTEMGWVWSKFGVVVSPIRREIVLSPDGSTLVFSAVDTREPHETRLYRRPLDGDHAEPIPGTKGGSQPFFSPDGGWIGFWLGGKLKKVSTAGGMPIELGGVPFREEGTDYPPAGAFWAEDGRIFLGGTYCGLLSISEEGGKVTPITEVERNREVHHVLPWVLPNGDDVLFTSMPHPWGAGARLEVITLSSGRRKVLLEDAADARYVPTGHLLLLRRGVLMAAPFDVNRLEVVGSAVPVQDQVQQALNRGHDSWNSASGQFWVSSTGVLVFESGGIFKDRPNELVWIDRQGQVDVVEGFDKPLLGQLDLSPDGRFVAFVERAVSGALWVFDMERATHTCLLSEGIGGYPVWSPDGKSVALSWSDGGPQNIWLVSVERKGERTRLTESENLQIPSSWTPDGKYLAVWEPADILVYSVDTGKLEPFIATDAYEAFPEFSPDGRWLAYVSDETKRQEVYVTAFPDRAQTLMISNQGGTSPIWSPSGTELFYAGPKNFMSVEIHPSERITAGLPRPLFDSSLGPSVWEAVSAYSIDRQGTRFLYGREKAPDPQAAEAETPPYARLNLVISWFAELNRLCPTEPPDD